MCPLVFVLCRKAVVQHLIQSFQRSSGSTLAKTFRVNYKRHVLTMDDLGTLYGQNWLNDQVHTHSLLMCVCVQTHTAMPIFYIEFAFDNYQ